MANPISKQELQAIRTHYESGVTKPSAFRMQQLRLLRQAVLKYEEPISAALYQDLKKSPEEVYGSETGLLLTSLNMALKNLRQWMMPQRAKTDLINLPSSCRIYKDPLGVVFIISPWNYPLQLLLIPLVGAISAGNCAVLKPSELAPATAAIIEKIILEIYPPEYIKVILGEGATVVPAALELFRFDHIFYTGSISVGKIIYQLAADKLVPVTLELGGKSPTIIEADADLKIAARRIALGKFLNAGQTCVAPDYLLVHESVKQKFLDLFQQTIRQFFGEDALNSYSYGKIINTHRFDILSGYLSQGKICIGGHKERSALFIAPTVIEAVPLDAPIMTEEIFGPILPIFGFQNKEEALAIIQKNPYPLAFYVFTTDTQKEKAWMEAVPFGGGCVNNTNWQFANPYLPFGGIGASGMGAYHGKYSFDTFTHRKPVMKTPTWFDPNIKYPPFNGKLKWLKLFIK